MSLTPIVQKMFSRCIVSEAGCWLWQGCLNHGYAWLPYRGKNRHGNRVVLIEMTGMNLDNPLMFACHKCPNKNCINPDHLYWGSRSDNAKDAVREGKNNFARDPHPVGTSSGKAVLTEEQVAYIRNQKKLGVSSTTLINELKLKPGTINNIYYNPKRWPHIT